VSAIASASLVMAGLGASLMIASRALPGGRDPLADTAAASRAMGVTLADVTHAIAVRRAEPTVLSIDLADRDGDAQPETIEYAWTGTPGDPLTRSINGGAEAPILQDVRTLRFDYDRRVRGTIEQTNTAEGEVIASFTQSPTTTATPNITTLYGQSFTPDAGPDAVSFSVESVRIFISRVDGIMSLSSVLTVELRRFRDDGTLSSDAIASATLPGFSISTTPSWHTAYGLKPRNLDPADRYAVVLRGGSGFVTGISTGAYALAQAVPGAAFVSSSDGGNTFFEIPTVAIPLIVEATVENSTSTPGISVHRVTMTLGAGDAGEATPVVGSVRPVALPEDLP